MRIGSPALSMHHNDRTPLRDLPPCLCAEEAGCCRFYWPSTSPPISPAPSIPPAGAWENPSVGAAISATDLNNRYITPICSLLIGAGIWIDLAVATESPRPPRTTALSILTTQLRSALIVFPPFKKKRRRCVVLGDLGDSVSTARCLSFLCVSATLRQAFQL